MAKYLFSRVWDLTAHLPLWCDPIVERIALLFPDKWFDQNDHIPSAEPMDPERWDGLS